MRKSSRPFLLLLALITFGAGGLCNATMGTAWASGYRSLDVFARVLAYVENDYVDEVSPKTLVYGAIKGMLSVLDPYTIFLAPDELASMRDDTVGEFGGLGIELAEEEGESGGIVVVSPLDESPASRAGIRTGDRILAIDDESTEGMTILSAVKRMRGSPGSTVKLRLMREGFSQPQEISVRRDVIRLQSVEARLFPDGFGYVRIKHFQEKTDQALGKALARLREENGGKDLAGLVLDLRNNPGGLLDQAVRVADRFLEKGVIVTTEGRGGRRLDVQRAHAAGTQPNYPLVVLVNGGSASASEIVAGALQDHGRAVLMGTKTFGKGSVQTVIDLEDGSGLKITIARYYTPKRREIQGKGIMPDVWVPDISIAQEQPSQPLRILQMPALEPAAPKPVVPVSPPSTPADPDRPVYQPPKVPKDPEADHSIRAALDALQRWEPDRSAATAAD